MDPRRRLARSCAVTGAVITLSTAFVLAKAHPPRAPLALPAGPSGSAAIAQLLAHDDATGALLVDFVEPEDGEGGSAAAIAAAVRHLGERGLSVEPAGFYSEGEHLYRVAGPAPALAALQAELAADPLVEGVEPEWTYALPDQALAAARALDPAPARPARPGVRPNDPMFPLQWHLEAIRAPEAWARTAGAGVTVAVIDTGVAYKHHTQGKVRARAVPDLAGIEFVHGASFVEGLPDGLDDHAHGTHVAGTIAQATNNGIGVAGVAHRARIMPLKVLGADGRGSVAAIANAIRYAADHGAGVINMSLGGPMPSRVLAKAVVYARSKGTVVVCAAGNERRSRVSYPAANPGAFAVAATDFSGRRAFYSNWGDELDISAPGGDTRRDDNGDGHPDGVLQNTIQIQDPSRDAYLWFMGTSMASPHVAGVAALVMSQGVTNPDEVERILQRSAKHPNGVAWDREYGAGVVDAADAVAAARGRAYRGERAALGLGLALLLFGGVALGAGGLGGGRARLRAVVALGVAGVVAGALGPAIPSLLAQAAGPSLTAACWSALLPLLGVTLALSIERARPVLLGIALGWATVALHGAVVLPTLLAELPGGPGWDRAFLFSQAALCAWLAWRVWAVDARRAPGEIRES